jgi:hypothetical protein
MTLKRSILGLVVLIILSLLITRDELHFYSNNYGLSDISYFDFTIPISNKFDDGPYTFINKKALREKKVIAGKIIEDNFSIDSIRNTFIPDTAIFFTNSKIAALSDIHGQYELFIKLLKNNGIIDSDLHWNFGDGHFVITGDIFDRGDEVLNALWFIFKLEEEAEAAGGKVHYLLGNHEYMVLHADLRYLHNKYLKTAKLFSTSYEKLFSKRSILGRWLRSKSTVIKINTHVFLHGGLSMRFLKQDYSLEETNNKFRESIDLSKSEKRKDPILKEFYGRTGPIWYRGYFTDSLKINHIDSILAQLNATEIIVGHTSQRKIEELFKGKIYAVDTSIKRGSYGEILLIENNTFFRGTLEGKKERLK